MPKTTTNIINKSLVVLMEPFVLELSPSGGLDPHLSAAEVANVVQSIFCLAMVTPLHSVLNKGHPRSLSPWACNFSASTQILQGVLATGRQAPFVRDITLWFTLKVTGSAVPDLTETVLQSFTSTFQQELPPELSKQFPLICTEQSVP